MSAPRHIYAVRHAERVDDVEGKKKCWYLNSHFSKDNPPLSSRGFVQACELHEEFRNIPIDYCFSSPYERCVQTASAILEGRSNVKINIEPGLLESLHVIYERSEVKRLDFQTNRELIHRFPNINQKYKAVFLAPPAGEELKGVQGCSDRVAETVRMIINKCQGDILIVSHMHPLAAIQRTLTGQAEYGGIATVSKYVESPGFEGCFSAEYLYDSSHLSDKTRLNGKDFNRREAKTSKKQPKQSKQNKVKTQQTKWQPSNRPIHINMNDLSGKKNRSKRRQLRRQLRDCGIEFYAQNGNNTMVFNYR